MPDLTQLILTVVLENDRLAVDVDSFTDSSNPYESDPGVSAKVNVMLALGDEFEVELPEYCRKRTIFGSIENQRAAVSDLVRIDA